MIGLFQASQDIYQNVYRFVLLQDFGNKSDINWEGTIDNIDEQLFVKYNLSDKEVEPIKGKIKKI